MLIGICDSIFEVGAVEIGTCFVSASVLRRSENLKLEIVGIYGPADHALSASFPEEISAMVARTRFPSILGGDSNLMRAAEEKNNDRINWARIELFNNHITD
jgi:hypothetical protein